MLERSIVLPPDNENSTKIVITGGAQYYNQSVPMERIIARKIF